MARNSLAGTKKGKSKSAVYYQENPTARAKKNEYNKDDQKKPARVKKRVETNRENRKLGTYGNKDGLDVAHKKGGKLKLELQSKNRVEGTRKKATSKKKKS